MVFGKNKSLACFKPNPNAALRLVCFPCAGGGASMYRVWAELLPDVEVWAVNYPGRESLHGQPFASNTDELAAGILENESFLKEKPCVFYGHSFGAFMAFDVAYKLQKRGVSLQALCVSARRSPHLKAQTRISDMPETQFLQELDRLGGLPEVIRANEEMMAFYLPIIKADLRLNDDCVADEGARLQCPLYLYSADEDRAADENELDAWRHCSTGPFQHRVFKGGHFFIQDQVESFLGTLRTALSQDDDDELIAY